jgi:translation initiation factor 2 alpha subunit (eIF-2alpha)
MLVLASVVGVGVAAAATDTLADSTFQVDNDTQSVYAEVTASDLSDESVSNTTANVTIYGIDDDGIQTVENDTQVTVSSNETKLNEVAVNATKYPEYRVIVEGNSSYASADVGTIQKTAGTGGVSAQSVEDAWNEVPGSPIEQGLAFIVVVLLVGIVVKD